MRHYVVMPIQNQYFDRFKSIYWKSILIENWFEKVDSCGTSQKRSKVQTGFNKKKTILLSGGTNEEEALWKLLFKNKHFIK